MRNLKLSTVKVIDFGYTVSDAKCISVDCMRGIVYIANSNKVFGAEVVDGVDTQEVIYTVNVCDAGEDNILQIEYLPDQEILCIATTSGELYHWNPESNELDSVGYVSSGITCMSWSPDFEVFVVTTGDHNFIIMTSDCDAILEGSIHSHEFGEATSVNVGWGKKETQFHGSAGKPTLEDLKTPEVKPVLPWDDQRTRITWPGDGSYFAISAVEPETGIRKIRIWSKDGVHFSTNEAVDGLEQALCWRPSGRVIASTQRKQNKHEVIFFENNGLRHGEFTLPVGVNDVKVMEMAWNQSSDMFAVLLEQLSDEGAQKSDGQNSTSCVQIWTCGNYHWYLKQELAFGREGQEVVSSILWDPEDSGKLHVLCASGKYLSYCWVTDVFHSIGDTDENISTVAVIDGRNALLTPFKLLVTPPPMAAQTLKLPAPINQLSFGPSPLSSSFAMVLSDGCLYTAMATNLDGKVKQPSYRINNFGRIHSKAFIIHHLLWLQRDRILYVIPSKGNADSSIVTIKLLQDDIGTSSFEVEATTPFRMKILSMCRGCDPCSALLQTSSGTVYTFNAENYNAVPYKLPNGADLVFSQHYPKMSSISIEGEHLVFGLSLDYRFYANGVKIANNCSSFAVHEDFLVMTTLEHECRCIYLTSLKKVNDRAANVTEFQEGVRAVERGSKIVVAVVNDSKVILQMPRGNLETIHPRALVVSSLKKMLSSLRYKEALNTMKRHRINLNLICDHDMKLFLDNIESFIEQIGIANDLNLFLADLSIEDVTTTLYKPYYSDRKETESNEDKNRSVVKDVDMICKEAREAFQRIDSQKYTLCILTTYVMQRNKDLESALKNIKNIRDYQDNASEAHTVTWEKALKYLLYLVDVNELYEVALGLYDFDLVLLVAEKSQKDPKEYLPYLNQLKGMEPNYRKYTIDMHLKRFKKALHHVAKSGPEHFAECLNLINAQHLYQDALELYEKGSPEYKEISVAYGNYLREQKRYVEAGLVFNRCENHKEALNAFSKAVNWTFAISSAFKLKMSETEVSLLCRRLSGDLKVKGRYAEAAYLLEVYSKDPEEAIMALIEGHRWTEALALIQRCERDDITETNLRPSLLEDFRNTISLLNEKLNQFTKFQTRLEIVREEKRKREAELIANEDFRDDPDNELFSDVSSITGQSAISTSSRSSRSSGHSSKSRRKSQRKKYSLKEGSQYEDFALMEALAEIVNTCDRMQDDIGNTIQTLVFLDYQKEADSLQDQFKTLYDLLTSKMDSIWKMKEGVDKTLVLGPAASTNSVVASMAANPTSLSSHSNPDLPEPTRAILRKDVRWNLSIVSQPTTSNVKK